MQVNSFRDKLNIKSEKIYYVNFRKFYALGDGTGLQVETDIAHKRAEVLELCETISNAFYDLWDILDDTCE